MPEAPEDVLFSITYVSRWLVPDDEPDEARQFESTCPLVCTPVRPCPSTHYNVPWPCPTVPNVPSGADLTHSLELAVDLDPSHPYQMPCGDGIEPMLPVRSAAIYGWRTRYGGPPPLHPLTAAPPPPCLHARSYSGFYG